MSLLLYGPSRTRRKWLVGQSQPFRNSKIQLVSNPRMPRTGALSVSPGVHIDFSPELDRSMGLTCHAQPVGSGRIEEMSRKCQVGVLLLGALVSLKAGLSRNTRPRRGVHGWMVPPGVLRKERPGTWPGLLRTQ